MIGAVVSSSAPVAARQNARASVRACARTLASAQNVGIRTPLARASVATPLAKKNARSLTVVTHAAANVAPVGSKTVIVTGASSGMGLQVRGTVGRRLSS